MMLLLVFGISSFSYKYIEQPSQRLARKLIKEVSYNSPVIKISLCFAAALPFCLFLIYRVVQHFF